MPKSLHAASKQNYNNNDSKQIIRRIGQNVSYPILVCYSQESLWPGSISLNFRQWSLASILSNLKEVAPPRYPLVGPQTLLYRKPSEVCLTQAFLLFSCRSRRFPQQGLTYPMIFTSLQETSQISSWKSYPLNYYLEEHDPMFPAFSKYRSKEITELGFFLRKTPFASWQADKRKNILLYKKSTKVFYIYIV